MKSSLERCQLRSKPPINNEWIFRRISLMFMQYWDFWLHQVLYLLSVEATKMTINNFRLLTLFKILKNLEDHPPIYLSYPLELLILLVSYVSW